MRSVPDDRTARAVIRDEALRLFADRGPEAVSVRQIAAGSLAEAVVRYLPPDSPVPAYLRGLLLSGGDAGRELFRRLYEGSRAGLEAMAAAGLAARGADPAVRAAILMSNDLAVLLLRGPLAGVLGTDPLSAAGMARWGREMLAIYAAGLMAAPPGDQGTPDGEGGRR